ncbi:MAG: hypothetical protein ABSA16_04425 [Thermoguttaceae bacterium]|jgi:hypothetical protein
MVKAQEKPEKAKRINRSTAANKVIADISGKTSLSELAKEADSLFTESGGKPDVRKAGYYVRRSLETLEAIGIVKLTRPTDIIVERIKTK